MTDDNGEFRGATKTRLQVLEEDVKTIKADVRTIRDQVMGWKAQLAILGVGLPILTYAAMHILFP